MTGSRYRFVAISNLAGRLVFFAYSDCGGMCERLKQAVLKTALP